MSIRPKPLALAGALALTIIAGSMSVPVTSANDRVVTVQPGQTLSQIAAAHGTTVERLVSLNDLTDPDRIYVGQRLRLRPATDRREIRRAQPIMHRVSYGETLTGVAARYGSSVEALARRNHLSDPSRIYVGQLLQVADGRTSAADQPRPSNHDRRPVYRSHTIQFGETLSGIAIRYRVSVEAIVAANGIANPSFIRAGETLRILARKVASGGGDQGATTEYMPPEMAGVVASRDGMRRLIAAEARDQRVPPSFALAVAWQESGWQPSVVSSAGAIGVMQLLPATADWVAATMLGSPVNLWEPRSNVRAGVRLLRHYLDRYDGSPSLALAAYYQGQAGTDRHGIYPVSRPYIASILLLEQVFRR
jgi:LysM repeat protein